VRSLIESTSVFTIPNSDYESATAVNVAACAEAAGTEHASATMQPIYADAAAPTTNVGTPTTLQVDGSAEVTTYVKFAVSGLPTPSSAALRLRARAATKGAPR
jgi:hypothetical protein